MKTYTVVTLNLGEFLVIGKEVRIKAIRTKGWTKRKVDLGIVAGKEISIRRK